MLLFPHANDRIQLDVGIPIMARFSPRVPAESWRPVRVAS